MSGNHTHRIENGWLPLTSRTQTDWYKMADKGRKDDISGINPATQANYRTVIPDKEALLRELNTAINKLG